MWPSCGDDRRREALARENERLQRALRARLSEEAALRRVATLVAQQHAPEEVFTLVTQEVARHLDADAAITVRYDGPAMRALGRMAGPLLHGKIVPPIRAARKAFARSHSTHRHASNRPLSSPVSTRAHPLDDAPAAP